MSRIAGGPVTGETLIAWGFKPGSWFKAAIARAETLRAQGSDDEQLFAALQAMMPVEATLRTNGLEYGMFLDAETEQERANAAAVQQHMDALMRVPTIVGGAVMPDACPSGTAIGTIPVGGAVATRDAIHPGFHSADICCSMAISVFNRQDAPGKLLDAVQAATHFGPGGRAHVLQPPAALLAEIATNPFLRGLENLAIGHFGSQGDGNHFAYVGQLRSTGQPALVTHHGSRGFGAQLFKRGMAVARKHTAIAAPRVPEHSAWIDANSDDGRAYWQALQLVRRWTRANHYAIHDLVAAAVGNRVADRFWNEHNFVFRRSDGLFYHGKGATPSWPGFSEDDDGRTLIPLNMSEPILITTHRDRKEALGFAPHGAGRNMSRTQHLKSGDPVQELAGLAARGLDIRSFCGRPDLSELPSAYKNAAAVRAQIGKYALAEMIDQVEPFGSIMAGDWEYDAPWRRKRRAAVAGEA